MKVNNKFYLGNENLKAANVPINFTAEQIDEIKKCSEDPLYFFMNYTKIVTADGEVIPFIPRDFQVDMVEKIIDNRYVLARWGRQTGKTTVVGAILLWYAMFNSNYTIAVLAHKEEQAQEFLFRIQNIFQLLPDWLQIGVTEWNKRRISFENGSRIFSAATSSGSSRGKSISILALDEFAFIPHNVQVEFFQSVFPTISSGKRTKVIITTTPNGMELFHKMWRDSEKGKNNYVLSLVKWDKIEWRDEEWKRNEIAQTSEQQFRQEHEVEFIGSTNTLIDPKKLETLTSANPIGVEGYLTVFKKPIEGHQYIVVADCSEGLNQDYHAAIAIDVSQMPYEVCAVWHNNNIDHLLVPNYLFELCRSYNNAVIMIETQSTGAQIAGALLNDLEYEGVLRTVTKANKGQRVGSNVNSRLGVMMNKQVKRIGCVNLKTLIERDKLILNDERIVQELYTFIADKTTFKAQEGHHDDLVMALVTFAWMANQDYFKDLFESDVRRNLYEENAEAISSDFIPFGFIDNHTGIEEEEEQVELHWSQLIF